MILLLALCALLCASCSGGSGDDPLIHRLDNLEAAVRAQAEVLREWQLEGYPITVHLRVMPDGSVTAAVPDSATLENIEAARAFDRNRRMAQKVPLAVARAIERGRAHAAHGQ